MGQATAAKDGASTPPVEGPLYALVGNPNCGKTTVFNALTGLRQKVGNYPGVTVEKKIGRIRLGPSAVSLIDLPGLKSLTPRSPDEAIARDVLLGHQGDDARPDAIIHVLDASNLERTLYLTSQVLEIGLPTVIVLTMTDIAERAGHRIDVDGLIEELAVPVVRVIADKNVGMDDLRDTIAKVKHVEPPRKRERSLPETAREEVHELAGMPEKEAGIAHAQSD